MRNSTSRKYPVLDRAGVSIPHQRPAAKLAIVPGPSPAKVHILLSQHIGAPCSPVVAVGDTVKVGTRIGDSDAFVSAPVHSSVSGKVTAIGSHVCATGEKIPSITVESDGEFELDEGIAGATDPDALSAAEIRKIVREAGVVGLGGAVFPTHVKLSPPPDKKIDTVIINGAECEPFLTSDYRLMLEKGDELKKGAELIRKAVNADRIVVGIEKADALAIRAVSELGMEVAVLRNRYPQGAEKVLIKTVLGREVPMGGLPMDVGALVNNVGTAIAVYDAVYNGMPLIERVLTVAGDGFAGRANLRVRIGTPVSEIIDHCGGFQGSFGKLIIGGPMMGLAQYTAEIPVTKGTGGILAFKRETAMRQIPKDFICIRCGRCVRSCPMRLMPNLLGSLADNALWEDLEELAITNCIECGCCTYVCPAKNPLVQLIKIGKDGLSAAKAKQECTVNSAETE